MCCVLFFWRKFFLCFSFDKLANTTLKLNPHFGWPVNIHFVRWILRSKYIGILEELTHDTESWPPLQQSFEPCLATRSFIAVHCAHPITTFVTLGEIFVCQTFSCYDGPRERLSVFLHMPSFLTATTQSSPHFKTCYGTIFIEENVTFPEACLLDDTWHVWPRSTAVNPSRTRYK